MKKIIDKENIKGVAGKGKGFISEFKAFVLRGNVMDMAIGVIIGTAFASIVTALTTDFINPLINGIGGAEIAGKIKIYGGQYILWGDFVTQVINFLIMAFVLFCMLKAMNTLLSLGKKKEEEEEEKEETPEIVKTNEEILLEEIRDLLVAQSKSKK